MEQLTSHDVEQVVRLLKAQAKQEASHRATLWKACQEGDERALRKVLESGVDWNAKNKEDGGNTALHIASQYRHANIVRILLHQPAVQVARDDGCFPLHVAAYEGHVDVATVLLHHGATNAGNHNGEAPLHMAASRGHTEMVKLLLERGAYVQARDKKGATPLLRAADGGHLQVAVVLLKKGADHTANNKGRTPLYSAAEKNHCDVAELLLEDEAASDTGEGGSTPLVVACETGNAEVARMLVARGAHCGASKDGATPLFMAAKNGHLNVVCMLLESGQAGNVNEECVKGRTALWAAASGGHADVVRVLIEAGGAAHHRDERGNTPLVMCALNGHAEAAKVLQTALTRDQIRARNNDGWSPLYAACRSGSVELARLLINWGADMEANGEKATPLHAAAQFGHLEVVKFLLRENVTMRRDETGQTPLLVAARYGHEEIVDYLLEKEADGAVADLENTTVLWYVAGEGFWKAANELLEVQKVPQVAKSDGMTPLHRAAAKGHLRIVELLLRNNAKHERAEGGHTPLYLAAMEGHAEVVALLCRNGAGFEPENSGRTPIYAASSIGYVDVVRALVEHGSPTNEASNDGVTPLLRAVQNGHNEIVEMLLGHGATPKGDNSNVTPLYIAAEKGNAEIVKLLLDKGAEHIKAPPKQRTPLCIAARRNHAEVVNILLEHGATHDPDEDGCSPLFYAAQEGNAKCVECLLRHGAVQEPTDDLKCTPLFIACCQGHVQVAQMLLKNGATHESTVNGHTPLFVAASLGHIEIVRALIEHGAPLEDKDTDGETALWQASRKGHVDIVKVLLDNGAVQKRRDNDEQSVLCAAAKSGKLELVALLVERGADLDKEAVIEAAKKGHKEVSYFLLGQMCEEERVGLRNFIDRLLKRAGATPQEGNDYAGAPLAGTTTTPRKKCSGGSGGPPAPTVTPPQREESYPVKWNPKQLEDSWHLTMPTDLILKNVSIEKHRPIASGFGGSVYKGRFGPDPAAIKVLRRDDGSPIGQESELMEEVDKLRKCASQRVVTLHGVYQDPTLGLCIVMEWMEGGSLVDFIRDDANELSDADRLRFALDAAVGLEYLASRGIVHADVAARNMLVFVDRYDKLTHVKVGDFGLAVALRQDDSKMYIADATFPVAWSPPEVIKGKSRFSEKSDVWSFGVLLWELWTDGEAPHGTTMTHREIGDIICERTSTPALRRPDGCPDGIWQLMVDCWDYRPKIRPSFSEIQEYLTSFGSPPPQKPVLITRVVFQRERPMNAERVIRSAWVADRKAWLFEKAIMIMKRDRMSLENIDQKQAKMFQFLRSCVAMVQEGLSARIDAAFEREQELCERLLAVWQGTLSLLRSGAYELEGCFDRIRLWDERICLYDSRLRYLKGSATYKEVHDKVAEFDDLLEFYIAYGMDALNAVDERRLRGRDREHYALSVDVISMWVDLQAVVRSEYGMK